MRHTVVFRDALRIKLYAKLRRRLLSGGTALLFSVDYSPQQIHLLLGPEVL